MDIVHSNGKLVQKITIINFWFKINLIIKCFENTQTQTRSKIVSHQTSWSFRIVMFPLSYLIKIVIRMQHKS